MKVCSKCRRCYGDRFESCTDQFHPPLSENIPGDPDMIDGYRLELLLHSEFSVDLFRARRTDSGPSCLIKIISGDDVDGFLSQARTASRFFHPNVTDVYESGRLDDGRGYIAMEDPDGRTIRELLDAEEAQPLLRSVEIVRQAAEALHAMHLAGLAHGAVNPRNIVVYLDGEMNVRVHNPDLGSVAARSIVSNKFLIDSALDSIRYFAPEQFNSEPACAQTDVYSLGIVFYEMLTGTPPFDAPTATALIHKQRTQSPPDIRITDFNLRMLVTHCLMESLQKQSRLRQLSADLFARQLRHIEQLATHTSTPPPAGVVPPQNVVVVKSASPAAVIIGPPVDSNAPVQLEAKREVEPTRPVIVEKPIAEPEERPVIVQAKAAPAEESRPHRSRLRRLKKKLHTMSGELVTHVNAAVKETPPVPPIGESISEPKIIPEPTPEAVILSQSIPEPAVITAKKPIKVAFETPDDDIPSIAEVLEVLSKESSGETVPKEPSIPQVVETPAPPDLEPVFAVAAAAASTTVCEGPRITVPTKRTEQKLREVIEAVPPQPKVIQTSTPNKVVPTAPSKRRSEERVAAKPAIVQQDAEEITQVKPPRRIRIDLEHPPAARPARRTEWKSEVAFTPTLLGKQKTRPTPSASSDSMFAAYYGETAGMTSIPYRPITTAAGVVALIMLFLFAGSSLLRYFQSEGSGDSSTTIASSTTQTALTPIGTQPKVEPVTVEQTVPAKSVEPERTQPVVAKPSKDKQEEPVAEAKVVKNPVIDKKPVVTTAAPRNQETVAKKSSNAVEPIRPSTMVIVKNRSSLLTRPRIVKDPKQ